MDKLKIKEEIKALYDDTEKCISNLVVSRGKRDEQGIADAHWHMESLMVNAQQMCSVILDSLQEEPSIPDIVDEHFDEMLGEEPVSKVWHTTMEEPNGEDSIVIVYDNGCTVEPSFKDFKSYSEWGTIKQSYRVKLWAYIDDLLNLSTVERNGKNLKELKTMLDDSLSKETEDSWNEFLDKCESEDLEKAAECIELEVINDWTYGKDPDHAVIPAIHYRLPHTFNVGDVIRIKIEDGKNT